MSQFFTPNLLVILAMAMVTYFTRIGGYLLLRKHSLSPRMMQVMEAAPGCVLITVIAPKFATGDPADLIALAITIFAATRFSLLPVVIIAVASSGVLRYFL